MITFYQRSSQSSRRLANICLMHESFHDILCQTNILFIPWDIRDKHQMLEVLNSSSYEQWPSSPRKHINLTLFYCCHQNLSFKSPWYRKDGILSSTHFSCLIENTCHVTLHFLCQPHYCVTFVMPVIIEYTGYDDISSVFSQKSGESFCLTLARDRMTSFLRNRTAGHSSSSYVVWMSRWWQDFYVTMESYLMGSCISKVGYAVMCYTNAEFPVKNTVRKVRTWVLRATFFLVSFVLYVLPYHTRQQ
jgi:hypothetical protein